MNFGIDGTASGQIGSNALEQLSAQFVKVAKEVKPSVVNISTTSTPKSPESGSQRGPSWEDNPFRDFFGEDLFRRFFQYPESRPRRSLGSGVIVSEDGYILTNNHVVAGVKGDDVDIKVSFSDDEDYEAKVIGTDEATDVAVIKIDAEDLPVAKLGNSNDLQVGQWVLAIGNPFRLSHTVTHGIISATGRSDVRIAEYEDFIQTDAPINPGNSGGPLVNIRGEVIGINTAIATAAGVPGNVGVGFAIPINMARSVMDQLIKTGKVVRGWLGISLQEVDRDIAEKYDLDEPRGVLVLIVSGPAKKAGLEPGDLILEIDGEEIRDGAHLKNLIAATRPGEEIRLKVIRGKKEREFKVELGERTPDALAELTGQRPSTEGETGEDEDTWLGMAVQKLTDELADRLGYDEDEEGVLITNVEPGSPATKVDSPPRPGDLIQEIERQEIKDMDDYRKAVKDTRELDSIMIRLRRARGGTWYVVIKRG
jgi:serine protease Do